MKKDKLKERILELNNQSTKYLNKKDRNELLKIRKEMTRIIGEYLYGRENSVL
jgi:hypothetical protein